MPRHPCLTFFALALTSALASAGSLAPQSHQAPSASHSISFTFQERLRGEWRDNCYDFDSSTDALTDDEWLLQRVRLGIRFDASPWLRVYAEGQDTREFFSDRPSDYGKLGAEGDDTFDLRQGYVEVGPSTGSYFRIGRQTLVYGDKRLISSGEWGNGSRTFDAIKFHLQRSDWWLDAFAASLVALKDGRFNQSDWLDQFDSRGQTFAGIYGGTSVFSFQATEAYLLGLHEDNAKGGTDFLTLGTRIKGDPTKLDGWEYDLEMAIQAGDVKGEDLNAWAGHCGLGYNWFKIPWKPRLSVDYNHASGDDRVGDGKSGSFQNLFPTNHLYYGYMDLFAWQNLRNPAVHLEAYPTSKVKVSLDYHWFWLDNTSDSWYRASIKDTARPVSPAADSYAGSEIDFTILWKANKHLDVQAGYSHFFAGDYLSSSGPADDANFAYVMVTLNY